MDTIALNFFFFKAWYSEKITGIGIITSGLSPNCATC